TVEPALERDEQGLARHARLLQHGVEDVTELALREPVDPLHLLLLAQLALIVRCLAAPSRRLAVLARRVGPPLDRAFFRKAARAFEKQLRALAAAQFAGGSRVACHRSDPPFLGRGAPVVGDGGRVADAADL